MTEPTDVRELREKIERADQMVTNLCKPRYTPNAREWTMSIPARPDHDPDLVIGAGLDAGRAALERLEKLEVRLPKSGDGAALLPGAKLWREHLGSVWHAEVVAVSVNWIDLQYTNDASHGAKWAISRRASPSEWLATPAPAPQQGGEQ